MYHAKKLARLFGPRSRFHLIDGKMEICWQTGKDEQLDLEYYLSQDNYDEAVRELDFVISVNNRYLIQSQQLMALWLSENGDAEEKCVDKEEFYVPERMANFYNNCGGFCKHDLLYYLEKFTQFQTALTMIEATLKA